MMLALQVALSFVSVAAAIVNVIAYRRARRLPVTGTIEISATEWPHFMRLADYFADTYQLAETRGDDELMDAAQRCLDDLAALSLNGDPAA